MNNSLSPPHHVPMETLESLDTDHKDLTPLETQNGVNHHTPPSVENSSVNPEASADISSSKTCGSLKTVHSFNDGKNTVQHEGYDFWTDDAPPVKRTKAEDLELSEGCVDNIAAAPCTQVDNGGDCVDVPKVYVPVPKVQEIKPSSPRHVEDGRSLRRSRKKPAQDGLVHLCPVCGVTIRPGELSSHLKWEMDKVDKVCRHGRKSGAKLPASGCGKVQPCSSSGGSNNRGNGDLESNDEDRYQAYLNIKERRQGRLCARNRRKAREDEETVCPVCEKKVTGTQEQLTEHVEMCLVKQEDEALSVDVVGDEEEEEYEEYEWAGQTRIRTTTLLPGGLAASGFQTGSKVSAEEEEDIDLDVDGCDQATFGEAQYSEKDLIAPIADSRKERKQRTALRRAYIRTEVQSVQSEPSERDRWKLKPASARPRTSSQGSEPEGEDTEPSQGPAESSSSSTAETEIIASLKAKIREQEELLGKDTPKCLICMEPYNIPLTSVQCWHVHCEECWLRTLGTKKLCPQCNMITSASDLRKVYL